MTLAALVIVGMVVAAAGGSCQDDNVLMQMNQDRRGRHGRPGRQNTGLSVSRAISPVFRFSKGDDLMGRNWEKTNTITNTDLERENPATARSWQVILHGWLTLFLFLQSLGPMIMND